MPTRIRNALSIDVEDYFHVNAFAPVISRDSWDSYELRVEANTWRLLDLFEARGVLGTFFVLGWVAARLPSLVKAIDAAGHEVACHGMTHELVYRQSPDVFRDQTRESKQRLEDITGRAVRGYRAASYSITHASAWALDILEDLGFVYDSSIVPARHDVYGMPEAPRHPYRPGGGRMLEIPLTTVEFAGLRVPCGGGGYFRIFPYTAFRWALQRVNDVDRMPAMFYLHPWEIDPGQPRIPGAGAKSNFRHYFNLSKTRSRLERLLTDFSWTRVDDAFGIA